MRSREHEKTGRPHTYSRWLLLLLAVALIGAIAAGCGGGSDDAAAPTEEPAPAETPAEEPSPAPAETPAEEPAPAAAGEGSIWVLLPDSASSARWETDDRRFFEEAFTAAGVEFNIVNAEGDAATQQSQAEQAIADGASVILLVSLDTGSGAAIIDQAKEAGVQVVEYDRFNTGGSGGAAYVSFDNVAVGAKMAEALTPVIDALGKSPARVVQLNGGEEDNNSKLFRAGYNATVEQKVADGSWELVADQYVPGWDNQEAQTIMEQILVDAGNDVDAVFAANDGLGNSVINAVEAAGFGPIPVSGQDATAAGIQNILLGKQTMTVYKPIEAEAKVAAAVALAIRAGQDAASVTSEYEFQLIGINAADGNPTDSASGDGVVPYFALTPIAVTVDNIADTVIADGFRTIEEICTGDTATTDFCTSQG